LRETLAIKIQAPIAQGRKNFPSEKFLLRFIFRSRIELD